jgi:hypothetical protein
MSYSRRSDPGVLSGTGTVASGSASRIQPRIVSTAPWGRTPRGTVKPQRAGDGPVTTRRFPWVSMTQRGSQANPEALPPTVTEPPKAVK